MSTKSQRNVKRNSNSRARHPAGPGVHVPALPKKGDKSSSASGPSVPKDRKDRKRSVPAPNSAAVIPPPAKEHDPTQVSTFVDACHDFPKAPALKALFTSKQVPNDCREFAKANGYHLVPRSLALAPHPVLATERAVAEAFVCDRAQGGLIWDVGGRRSRHDHNQRNVWCTQPRRTFQDIGGGDCDHAISDCRCPIITEDDAVSLILLVHSVYYLTPLDFLHLATVCPGTPIYSIEHRFDPVKGSGVIGEAKYKFVDFVGGQVGVAMSMDDGDVVHTHPLPLFALRSECIVFESGGQICKKVFVQRFGATYVYRYVMGPKVESAVAVQPVLHTRPVWSAANLFSMFRSSERSSFTATQVADALLVDHGTETMKNMFLDSFIGPLLAKAGVTRDVVAKRRFYIPDKLLAYLNIKRLSPVMTRDGLVEAARQWFMLNEPANTDASLLGHLAVRLSMHYNQAAIDDINADSMPWPFLMVPGFVASVACIPLSFLARRSQHEWAKRFCAFYHRFYERRYSGVTELPPHAWFWMMLVWLAAWVLLKMLANASAGIGFVGAGLFVISLSSLLTRHRSATVRIPEPIVRLPPTQRPFSFPREGTMPSVIPQLVQQLRLRSDVKLVKLAEERGRPKDGRSLVIGPELFVRPVVIQPSAEAENVAVLARVFAPRPKPDDLLAATVKEAWALRLTDVVTRSQLPRSAPSTMGEFADSRKLSKQRKLYKQAILVINEYGDLERVPGWDQRDVFVKLEKVFHGANAAIGQKPPRVIVGATPAYQVATGPHVEATDHYWAACESADWQEPYGHLRVRYTAGWTADRLSEEFTAAVVRAEASSNAFDVRTAISFSTSFVLGDDNLTVYPTLEGVRYLINDFSNFDTTHNEHSWAIREESYRILQMNAKCITRLKHSTLLKMRSRRGLNAECRWNMPSGNPDTCLGNSIVNAAMFNFVLTTYYASNCVHDMVSWANDVCTRFGFRPKCAIYSEVASVDYLSGVFLREGDEYFWIPKVFRLLSKLAVVVNGQADRNVMRQAMAQCFAYAHDVPVLRAYSLAMAETPASQAAVDIVLAHERAHIYKPTFGNYNVNLDRAFCDHYGISHETLMSMEGLIADAVRVSLHERVVCDSGPLRQCLARDVPDLLP